MDTSPRMRREGGGRLDAGVLSPLPGLDVAGGTEPSAYALGYRLSVLRTCCRGLRIRSAVGFETVGRIHPTRVTSGSGRWIIGLVGEAGSLGWCRDWNLGGVGSFYEAVGA